MARDSRRTFLLLAGAGVAAAACRTFTLAPVVVHPESHGAAVGIQTAAVESLRHLANYVDK